MHPQLDSPRFISCQEVIEALEQCHRRSYLERCFGICNNEKEALTKCLHEARMESQKHQILKRKEERKKVQDNWKKLKEDEYGDEQFLKKLLEREKAKKGN
ncbi:CYFA0S04e06106g1_1 [Cyberlindnera fabianii]|uniref:COX assembly mitochondrial protein n=1 Tax=Cyberlindnera fabianii TaxID=36022 RepID=A0A061ARE5_CYBFA|nr:COX assembly mitochondrial protein 2 [Cyberlindnera fabianii]CDR40216.1 CYFA0S04e06106g1_1 [Cyberlindnera fabianii]